MTIEEIRAALMSSNAEVEAARKEGVRLAMDKTSSNEQLEAQRVQIEGLVVRQSILRDMLEDSTKEQSARTKPVKAEQDQVQEAAKAFRGPGDFFRAVARERSEHDARLKEYGSIRSAASGQNLATDAEGGYLVPPDYTTDLLKLAQSQSILFPEVRRVPISGNQLITTRLVETTREDSVKNGDEYTLIGRNSGLLAYWISEAAAYTPEKLHFVRDTLELHKLTGLAYATDEMLEDASALAGVIADGFRDEFTFRIDNAILNGSGTEEPTGTLSSKNKALITIAKEPEQAAGSIVLENLLNMYNAMPAGKRANAKWYINQDVEMVLMRMLLNTGGAESAGEEAVEQLRATMGVPLWIPAGGLSGSPYSTLLGRPVVPVEQCAAVGDVGDIVFADLSQYRWIDKGGMTATTSMHVRFLYDEQAFKFTYRAGGKPTWPNPLKAYKGGTVRSPYVALAARK